MYAAAPMRSLHSIRLNGNATFLWNAIGYTYCRERQYIRTVWHLNQPRIIRANAYRSHVHRERPWTRELTLYKQCGCLQYNTSQWHPTVVTGTDYHRNHTHAKKSSNALSTQTSRDRDRRGPTNVNYGNTLHNIFS